MASTRHYLIASDPILSDRVRRGAVQDAARHQAELEKAWREAARAASAAASAAHQARMNNTHIKTNSKTDSKTNSKTKKRIVKLVKHSYKTDRVPCQPIGFALYPYTPLYPKT